MKLMKYTKTSTRGREKNPEEFVWQNPGGKGETRVVPTSELTAPRAPANGQDG